MSTITRTALHKTPIHEDQTFEIRYLREPHFDPNWHFHDEYQLFVVLKGTGTRFIGDHVASFTHGDLVLTGPNLPHLWRSDAAYFQPHHEENTEGLVIYFREDFLGKEFLKRQEMYKVKQLLHKANRGMRITNDTAKDVTGMMLQLLKQSDFNSVLGFLTIINMLCSTADYQLLASSGYSNSMKESDSDRMNQVHEYVMKRFHDRITLEEVAALANMTPSSFSRYFKVHANKTFSDFLIEIRIGHSCKLLMQENKSISEVCYESGFNTLSHFNRQFKIVTTYTPLEYRKKYAAD
jgi:AraC-like DNA-binding protein/quercetin dioxygenase-like cupin family protein